MIDWADYHFSDLDFLPQEQIDYLSLHSTGKEFILYLIKEVEHHYKGLGQEILKGAHVIFTDNKFYQSLIEQYESIERFSSHHKGNKIKEHGMNLGLNEVLFGINKDSSCWIQLEKSPLRLSNPFSTFYHTLDYLKYKITGKNVGPLGLSRYTEYKPIIINYSF